MGGDWPVVSGWGAVDKAHPSEPAPSLFSPSRGENRKQPSPMTSSHPGVPSIRHTPPEEEPTAGELAAGWRMREWASDPSGGEGTVEKTGPDWRIRP